MHYFLAGIFNNEHDRSLAGLLVAVAVLLHLAIFPAYIAHKRRHPRAKMIALASFSIFPLGLGLWLTETEWLTMGVLLGACFLYFLVWAYRSKVAVAGETNQVVAERLSTMFKKDAPQPQKAQMSGPMEFEIVGVDRKSGKPTRTVIEAATSADAKLAGCR